MRAHSQFHIKPLSTHVLPDVEVNDAVCDLGDPQQVVGDDERPALGRLGAEQPRKRLLPLGIDATRRLVEDEELGLGREHRRERQPLALAR